MSWYQSSNDKSGSKLPNLNQRELYPFSVKKGEKKNFMFLSDDSVAVLEATIPVNGSFKRVRVNPNDPKDPVVLHNATAETKKKLYIGEYHYFTVLDLTPYEDKEGKQRLFSKKPLRAPAGMLDKVTRRRHEAGGDLTGCVFTAFRDGDKEPGCGGDWTFVKKVDIKQEISSGKITAEIAKPYDFIKELAPSSAMTSAYLAAYNQGSVPAGESFSRDSIAQDPFAAEEPALAAGGDDIPF